MRRKTLCTFYDEEFPRPQCRAQNTVRVDPPCFARHTGSADKNEPVFDKHNHVHKQKAPRERCVSVCSRK